MAVTSACPVRTAANHSPSAFPKNPLSSSSAPPTKHRKLAPTSRPTASSTPNSTSALPRTKSARSAPPDSQPDNHPGSYVFLALADPATRAGLVAGLDTFERGDGILFSGATEIDHLRRPERLRTPAIGRANPSMAKPSPSASLTTSGSASNNGPITTATNKIKLRPQLSGYCTWYSNPHGGASDETHIRELADFAGRELKPYGFDYVQIDDKWQDGKGRHGPAKVFERVNPNGPYPSGMKPAAAGIRAEGLIPGIWYMPFAGDQEDPWFADKQHWFVKRDDGSVYFTPWGGGSLDLSHPEVQAYIRDLAKRIGRDWGYGLFKLDGLWTGLANAQLYVNNPYKPDDLGRQVVHDPSLTPFQAYHTGFRALREGAGDDVFILGCNISQNMRSFAAAIGMVDAMRIGPDNGPGWQLAPARPMARHQPLVPPPPHLVQRPRPALRPRRHADRTRPRDHLVGRPHRRPPRLQRVAAGPAPRPPRSDQPRAARPILAARPVDVLEHDLAQAWHVSNPAQPQRHLIALFQWDANKAGSFSRTVEQLEFPPGETWVGYEILVEHAGRPLPRASRNHRPRRFLQGDLARRRPPASASVGLLPPHHPRAHRPPRGNMDRFHLHHPSAGSDLVANDSCEVRILAASGNSAKAANVKLDDASAKAGATAEIQQLGRTRAPHPEIARLPARRLVIAVRSRLRGRHRIHQRAPRRPTTNTFAQSGIGLGFAMALRGSNEAETRNRKANRRTQRTEKSLRGLEQTRDRLGKSFSGKKGLIGFA